MLDADAKLPLLGQDHRGPGHLRHAGHPQPVKVGLTVVGVTCVLEQLQDEPPGVYRFGASVGPRTA